MQHTTPGASRAARDVERVEGPSGAWDRSRMISTEPTPREEEDDDDADADAGAGFRHEETALEPAEAERAAEDPPAPPAPDFVSRWAALKAKAEVETASADALADAVRAAELELQAQGRSLPSGTDGYPSHHNYAARRVR